MATKRTQELLFLDSLRGFAALYVVIGHARWLLWEGYTEGYLKHPELYNIFEKGLVYVFSLFKFGHEAVLFFFVLSGFVIHLKQAKAIKKGELNFNYRDYLRRRFSRIYPPFLFAIALTFILDIIGYNLQFTIYTKSTLNTLINHSIGCDLRLENLISNLFFWKTETTSTYGTNGPLWSLKYEWWFYMLYPILLVFSTKIGSIKTAILVAFVSLTTLFLTHPTTHDFVLSILAYLLSWWLGAILADIYAKRIAINYGFLAPFVLLIPVLLLKMKTDATSDPLIDTFWALSFFGLLNLFFYLQTRGWQFSFLNRFVWIGDCSYTLYVTHFPILVFISGIMLYFNDNMFLQTPYLIPLATFFCLLLAYRLHFWIEKIEINPNKGYVKFNNLLNQ